MNKITITILALLYLIIPSNSYATKVPCPQNVKVFESYQSVMEKCGNTFSISTEFDTVRWTYNYKYCTYQFIFNNDGMTIEIQCFGKKSGKISGLDISLGDSIINVYDLYGWPDRTSSYRNAIKLEYHTKHNVDILVSKNENDKFVVIGIITSCRN